MAIRFAASPEEATYRYPTFIKGGGGYFGDGMKYLVADNAGEVLEYLARLDLNDYHLQHRPQGQWEFYKEVPR